MTCDHIYNHWMVEHCRFVEAMAIQCKAEPKCERHDKLKCVMCEYELTIANVEIGMEPPLARVLSSCFYVDGKLITPVRVKEKL